MLQTLSTSFPKTLLQLVHTPDTCIVPKLYMGSVISTSNEPDRCTHNHITKALPANTAVANRYFFLHEVSRLTFSASPDGNRSRGHRVGAVFFGYPQDEQGIGNDNGTRPYSYESVDGSRDPNGRDSRSVRQEEVVSDTWDPGYEHLRKRDKHLFSISWSLPRTRREA